MATDRQQLYQKHDRLRQLRVFCHTARLGSLTKAAEQLRLSPPAVSLQVRELERELEAVLFDRGGPRIALSPAGERLYQLAMPLVEGMDRLPDTLAGEVDDLVSGDLHVASGDAGAVYVLPRVLKRLRDEHPGIRTSVRIGVLGSGLALLLADEVELVFGAKGPVSEDFVYHPVLSYDLVLVTSRDHPLAGRETVSREETAAHPVIMPDFGTYSLQGGESPLRHLGIEASVVIEVGGWDVVERYVEAGLGIASRPHGLRQLLRQRGEPGVGHPAPGALSEAKLRVVHASRQALVSGRRVVCPGDGGGVSGGLARGARAPVTARTCFVSSTAASSLRRDAANRDFHEPASQRKATSA